ncbi:MAG: hypothetical protein ABI131_05480 [Nostocoides sp.]
MDPRVLELRRVAPGLLIGAAAIVAGGLVAAVTASAPTEHATWAAAYLVLVVGVGQVGLAIGQALLASTRPPPWTLLGELVAWNVGNAAVLAGTLTGETAVVDVGGGLLVVALAALIAATRGAGRGQRGARYAFRGLVLILLVSIPIGLWLAGRPGA